MVNRPSIPIDPRYTCARFICNDNVCGTIRNCESCANKTEDERDWDVSIERARHFLQFKDLFVELSFDGKEVNVHSFCYLPSLT